MPQPPVPLSQALPATPSASELSSPSRPVLRTRSSSAASMKSLLVPSSSSSAISLPAPSTDQAAAAAAATTTFGLPLMSPLMSPMSSPPDDTSRSLKRSRSTTLLTSSAPPFKLIDKAKLNLSKRRTELFHVLDENPARAALPLPPSSSQDPAPATVMRVLQDHFLFSGMTPDNLDGISRALRRKLARQVEVVIAEGDPGDFLYIVETGKLSVTQRAAPGVVDVLREGARCRGGALASTHARGVAAQDACSASWRSSTTLCARPP
jgi:hypothetical protein